MGTTDPAAEAQRLIEGLSTRDRAIALDLLRRFAAGKDGGPYARATGLVVERMGEGRARVRVEAGPVHWNPLRIVHGGALFTLVDTAMAMALHSAVTADDRFSGVELKINFLAPTKEGTLVCDAWVRRLGGRVAVLEAEVKRPDGELVAVALGTNYVIRKSQ